MALLAITAARSRGPAFDELAHLTAGVSYLQTGDFRFQPENGLLPQAWAGLAVAGDPTVALPPTAGPVWDQSDVWTAGQRFFFEQGNQPSRLLGRARAMVTVLGVLCALLVWLWSRALFGPVGGLLSLTLCALSPAMLAHGALVTSDMATALFFLASTAALWRLLERLNVGGVLLAAAALCGLTLSKASAALIVPIALVLVVARLARREALPVGRHRLEGPGRQAAALGLVALVVGSLVIAGVWAAYGARWSAFEPELTSAETEFNKPLEPMLERTGALEAPLRIALERRLLPQAWVYGFTFVLAHSRARPAFLRGEHRDTGWWWFFPYAMAVKTPLPLLALLVLGLVGAAREERRRDLVPLAALVGVYWAFSVTSNLNIGHRHLLPTLPPLFVLAGGGARWLRGPGGARLAMLGLLVGLLLSTVAAFPRYLGFFNRLVGGPSEGWRHLVDSSLDWGQDLPALSQALAAETGPVALSYFGSADPRAFGIDAEPLPSYFPLAGSDVEPTPLTPGLYAISATMLQAVYLRAAGPWTAEHEARYRESFARWLDWRDTADDPAARAALVGLLGSEQAWRDELALFAELRFARLAATLRQREPDGRAGWSILLYRVGPDELKRAVVGPAPG